MSIQLINLHYSEISREQRARSKKQGAHIGLEFLLQLRALAFIVGVSRPDSTVKGVAISLIARGCKTGARNKAQEMSERRIKVGLSRNKLQQQ